MNIMLRLTVFNYPRYRINFPFITIIIFVFLSLFSYSFAEPLLEIDAEKQFSFAEYLFNKGDYIKSADEYQRFIFFFPKDIRVEHAMFQIGMSFFHLRHFKEAVVSFNALIDKYKDTRLSLRSYVMISECHLNRKEFNSAVIALHNLIHITSDIQMKDEAYYRLGWIYIETASWDKARTSFSKISAPNKENYRLKDLAAELDKEKRIPQKNPHLAGMLSIVPGAGYVYLERYQDALIAFLVNAGLILAAYESFDNELYALGGLITFVELGFYAGNIYGAVSSTHKYNRNETHYFIENLKKNSKIKFSSTPKAKAFMLTFEYSF